MEVGINSVKMWERKLGKTVDIKDTTRVPILGGTLVFLGLWLLLPLVIV